MMRFRIHQRYLIFAVLPFLTEVTIAKYLKSGFIRHTFGDYLVVILAYCIIRATTIIYVWQSAIIALILAFIIESLQLTTFLKFLGLENNKLANIIFGNTFQFSDLIAYTLGIITVLFVETKSKPHNKTT